MNRRVNNRYDTIARNTTLVLVLLVLAAFALIAAQRIEIREMRGVDCAAYGERVSRVGLYDDLVRVWSRDETLPAGERRVIVDAYARQRLALIEAIEAGTKQGCG